MKKKKEEFKIQIHQPYEDSPNGYTSIPYIVDGLLPAAAFSVLGGKPKHGKSSMSRCIAVAVSKGKPFLDRDTRQSEVLLCSLEDPLSHLNNCLRVLEYDPATDARVHLVHKLPRNIAQTVDQLNDALSTRPDIQLVILDTLAKVIRAKDSSDYDEMLMLCEQLHTLARQTGVHIQALTHCKKVQPEDPFDGFLGSVEVRAESDTNIVLFDSRGKRLLQSETRVGVPWEPTEIHADLVTVNRSQMVKQFHLGATRAETDASQTEAREKNTMDGMKLRILAMLKNGSNTWHHVKATIVGNSQMKTDARDGLIRDGIVKQSGTGSKTSPFTLTLLKGDWNPNGITVSQPEPDPVPYDALPVCHGCSINKIAGAGFNAEWGAEFCSKECGEALCTK